MKKLNNKGFSLVELIIVIAIMVILVAVLAPQFTKYVERSRVSTDIQTASEIATAVEVAIAEGKIAAGESGSIAAVPDAKLTSITALPKTKSNVGAGKDKTYSWAVDTNLAVTVTANSKQLYPTPDPAYSAYID